MTFFVQQSPVGVLAPKKDASGRPFNEVAEFGCTRQNASMNHLSTIKLLLLIFATAIAPPSLAAAQATPPKAPVQTDVSDPATDADFYLDKATTKIAEIQTFVDSLRTHADLRQYPFRPVVFSQRDTAQALQTLKLAKAQIDLLPGDVSADRLDRHRMLLRQAKRLGNYLTQVRTNLQVSLDPRAFPELKADAFRFRGIGMMLANIDSFESDPQLAATIVSQLPAARQEASRITAKYDLLITQETIAGLQLAGLQRYFESKQKSFEAITKQQMQALPERIKSDLTLAKETLAERQQSSEVNVVGEKQVELHRLLRKIEAEINLLEAIDPQSSASLLVPRQQLIDLMGAAKKIEPADVYVGDDREELEKGIMLLRAEPGRVNIRIPSKTWTRQKFWRFDGLRWLRIDRSILQAYLLAKDSDDASSGWQGFVLTKDHLNKNAVSVQRD